MVLKNGLNIIVLLCAALNASSQALNAPVLRCAQVQANGNVDLQWTQVPDPLGQFVSYQIWSSDSPDGTYTLAGTVNTITTTSFLHGTITPLISNECYYLITESSDGVDTFFSSPSNTVCTISLDAFQSIAPPGQVQLTWTSAYPAGIVPSGTGPYEVWMEFPAGLWTLIATHPLGTQSHSFEITHCGHQLNFIVRQQTSSGCEQTSDIAGGVFYDTTPPDIPEVTSVSIEHASNDAVIEWNPSNAPDTQGYILYRCNNASVTLLDTIYGAVNTNFTDLLAPTGSGPVCYLLASIDTCYTGTPPSPNTSPTSDVCHCSVFLSPVAYGICNNFINLNWTHYTGWMDGPEEYLIYYSSGGGNPELIGTVPGNQNSFAHEFENIVSGTHYYYVEAVSPEGYRSISNLRSTLVTYPTPPLYNYLSSASVTGRTEATVTIHTTPTTTQHFYHLDRRRFEDTDWAEVFEWSNLLENSNAFVDPEPEVSSFPHTYRVRVRNLCGDWVDTTNIGRTVMLRGLANNTRLHNVLQWTHYEGWENGVLAYRIYRTEENSGTEEYVDEVNGTQNYYEDDVADELYSSGRFCYRVEAIERPSDVLPNEMFTANSNILCLALDPVIWVPNAFVVDGFNRTFRPIISFADFSQYRMIVYSRWGDVIFETTDIEDAWDGRMNGKLVQEGVYTYFITVKDGNGRPHEARGTVTMLSNRHQ